MLAALYSTPDAVCTAECSIASDRALLQTWYGSFCQIVGQGIDPLTVTASTNANTTRTQSAEVASATSSQSTRSETLLASTSNSSPALSPTATPSATSSKSGLSQAATIAVGVVVPVAILGLVAVAFFFFRKRKRTRRSQPPASPEINFEKPELTGSRYDPAIAGPVHPKSELPSKSAKPHPKVATKDDTLDTGSALPELDGEPSAYELGLGSLNEQERKALANRSTVQEHSSRPDTIAAASQPPASAAIDEDLIAEADLLVQELGLIQARKKALQKSAAASKSKPEDVQGIKGEDYRDLIGREVRVRKRIEEIGKERDNDM